MPRLFAAVKPAGILAVQMPRNHDFATHALMRQVAAEGRGATAWGAPATPRRSSRRNSL